MGQVQRNGGRVAFIDAERSFDPIYAGALGLNVPETYFSRPDSGEDAMIIVQRLAATGAVDMIVVDSAAALLPRQEQESGLSDPEIIAAQARMMSNCLRRLNGTVARGGTALIFLNQMRT